MRVIKVKNFFFVTGYKNIFDQKKIKEMSLELFHKVPAGATETLFDEQKQPVFKRADLGKYLNIERI